MRSKEIISVILLFAVLSCFSNKTALAQEQAGNYKIDDLIQTIRISPRVLLVRTGINFFDAVTAIATEKGIVMMDAGFTPQMTERYKKIIAKEFNRNDFKYVINTHSHWDHTYGNQAFPEATIIGQDNSKTEMIRVANDTSASLASIKRYVNSLSDRIKTLELNSSAWKQAFCSYTTASMVLEDLEKKTFKLTPPSVLFTDRLTLTLGDLTFELVYFGPTHTKSDILVYIPEEKLLFTGDMFFSGGVFGVGMRDITKQNANRWHEVLSNLLVPEKGIAKVIHGHGMILTKEDITTAYEQNIFQYWKSFNEGKEFFNPDLINQVLTKSGIDAAVEEFRRLMSAGKDKYFFIERGFKDLGNSLLNQNKPKEAVEIFKMNAELYPESWEVYDRLGEAYMRAGLKEPALNNYEKSLKLNPENTSAIEKINVLKQIKGKE